MTKLQYMRVTCHNGFDDLSGLVRESEDLDGVFTMVCDLTGETLRVCGWMAEGLEIVERGIAA